MKPSAITTEVVRRFLRLDDLSCAVELEAILAAARQYAMSYTGLDAERMDAHEDIALAILVICADLHDNRQMTTEKSAGNRTVQSILDLHTVHFI